MQEQWTKYTDRTPIAGEHITFNQADKYDPNEVEYEVTVVHWFLSETGTWIEPYVSLRQVN